VAARGGESTDTGIVVTSAKDVSISGMVAKDVCVFSGSVAAFFGVRLPACSPAPEFVRDGGSDKEGIVDVSTTELTFSAVLSTEVPSKSNLIGATDRTGESKLLQFEPRNEGVEGAAIIIAFDKILK